MDKSMLTCRVLSFMVRKEIQAVIKKRVFLSCLLKKRKRIKRSTIQTWSGDSSLEKIVHSGPFIHGNTQDYNEFTAGLLLHLLMMV